MRRDGVHQLATSTEGITRFLASGPTPRALRLRLSAIDDLIAQSECWFPWPALQDSLRSDADRLRAALHRHG